MEIIVIGSETDKRLSQFHDFARLRGFGVTTFPPDSLIMAPNALVVGIVCFDRGTTIDAFRYWNVPLVDATRANSGRTPSNEQILEPILHNRNVQPVSEELRAALVEPSIAAAMVTFHETAATDLFVRAVYRQKLQGTLGDIAATLELRRDPRGILILDFPTTTANELTKRCLAESGTEIDDGMIRDCIGEFANVVAGQLKTLTAGSTYTFNLSIPEVVVGVRKLERFHGSESLVIVFGSDLGDVALQICPV